MKSQLEQRPCLTALAHPPISGRVRRWLHLPPAWQRTTGLVGLVLSITATYLLSSSVAGRAAPCRAADFLQPLEEKAARASPAGWHRFCLLLGRRQRRWDDRQMRRGRCVS